MAARDRECGHGVGPICRLREATVNERRQSLDLTMHAVEQTADPQAEAAIKIVAWVTAGALRPSGNDFAMPRLALLALLPRLAAYCSWLADPRSPFHRTR